MVKICNASHMENGNALMRDMRLAESGIGRIWYHHTGFHHDSILAVGCIEGVG